MQEHLRLRPLQYSDAHALADFYRRNWTFFKPWFPAQAVQCQSNATCEALVHNHITEVVNGRSAYYIIEDTHSTHVVGRCSLTQIHRSPFYACYMGYSIDQTLQGQGIMREVCSKVIEHAFNELNLHRIMANYMPHNNRSARLLKSLGFVKEGLARDYLEINGRWENHILTALTR